MTTGLVPALVLLALPPQDAQAKPDPRDQQTDPSQTIPGRRRPGYEKPLPPPVSQDNPGAVRAPPPEAFPTDQIPVPDRWRLIQSLGVVQENWLDPYHQNTLKGDRPINRAKVPWLPIHDDDWFFVANAVSDTVIEPRTFPIPVGVQTTERPQSLDVFGKQASHVASQTFILGASLYKGSTTFKPPEIEYRVALAINVSHVDVPERRILDVRPSAPSHRTDSFVGVQELFVDYHVRNVSDRYDFDSIRVGIQPFQADFRGFLFNDQQLGIRLFGNRDGNRFQYNLAAFWRLEKDTNSGLNSVITASARRFRLRRQRLSPGFHRPRAHQPGHRSLEPQPRGRRHPHRRQRLPGAPRPARRLARAQLRRRLSRLQRRRPCRPDQPHRLHLCRDRARQPQLLHRPPREHPRVFRRGRTQLRSQLDALPPLRPLRFAATTTPTTTARQASTRSSRTRSSRAPTLAIGSASRSPSRAAVARSRSTAATACSIRLRSSKEEGQSNFNNPGTVLLGVGGDFDLTPKVRVSANVNHLAFVDTIVLQTLRNEGTIPKNIGWDLSTAAIWRPKATQNIVMRLSGAVLLPGSGFRDLFANRTQQRRYYSVLANVILSY